MQQISHVLPKAIQFRQAEQAPAEPIEARPILFPTKESWWDYVMTHPTAPRIEYCKYGCGGAGFMRYDYPIGHPLCGKSTPCQCLREKQALTDTQRIEAYRANLSPAEQEWTLESWVGDDAAALQEAYRATAQGWGMWCFHGKVGVGKSGLLLGIVNKFLDRHEEAIYKVATQMLDQLRSSYETDSFESEMNLLRAVKVLAVDEMWRFSGTAWAQEKIFQLLDYRSRYWDRMLTVIATNEEPNYADPLWSRFNNGQTGKIVRVTGRDQRPLAG